MKSEHKTFHPNGNLHYCGITIKGKKHGVWNYYYPNGYFHKQKIYKMGVLDGTVKEYDMEFSIISTILYKDGEPIPF